MTVRVTTDTGATSTVIDEAALAPLRMMPTGVTSVHTPSTAGFAVNCLVFEVDLSVLDPTPGSTPFVVGDHPVIANDLAGTNTQGLLGCDILARCLYTHDGRAQTITLAF